MFLVYCCSELTDYGTSGTKPFFSGAQEEHFIKAAQQLHVMKPALSRQIAQLEEELWIELFIWSNLNVILIESGMIFKCQAQEILCLADKTNEIFCTRMKIMRALFQSEVGNFYLPDI